MLSLVKLYHFKAAAVPLALAIFLVMGSLNSCSEDPPTGGKDSCDTCNVPCDTCEVPCDTCDTTKPPCDTCNIDKDSAAHAFIWTEYTIPTESNLTGAYVASDNEIYVIGTYLYRFNGVSWNKVDVRQEGTGRPLAFPDFSMFGISSSDIWIVKYNILDHYIGNDIAIEYREYEGIQACWGTSSSDMFFVGLNGMIVHFDGTTFTKMTSPTTKDLRSVWGTSHNDVWACGYNTSNGETVLLHYDGNSWVEDEVSVTKGVYATGGFNSVWTCDSAGHKFVTTSGAILIRKTDNNLWRSDSGLVPNGFGGGEFIGIAPKGNTANDFMVYGPWGFVTHWNGKAWKKFNELYNYSLLTYYSAAFSMKGNTACVVGSKNGTSWIAIGRRKPF
ncbi:MAG TPA: hypothetical protein VIX80_10700 [Candidatus Kapabacteria bacterium]